MRELINKITMGKPSQMIGPVLWIFAESFYNAVPAVCTYFAIYYIVSAFGTPGQIELTRLWHITVLMVLVMVVHFLLVLGAYLNTFLPAARHSAENKKEFIKKLRTLPLGFFIAKKSGELINTFINDFLAIERSMVGMFTGIFSVIFSCVLTAALLFLFNPRMALAMYICMPVAAIVVIFALRIVGKYTRLINTAKDEAATYLKEYLLGMKTLKSFHMTGAGFKNLEDAYRHLMEVNIKSESLAGSLLKFATSLIRIGLPLMCFAGAYMILGGRLDIVDYLGLIIIGTKVLSPIISWIQYLTDVRMHYISATRIDHVMAAPGLPGSETAPEPDNIRFDNVSFAYQPGARPVLRNINLSIPPHQLTAIVGPSGSGKTTILRLIARFWDPTGGEIRCGSRPLSKLNIDSWLGNVSMVLQDVYLFHETIRENIQFGKPDADMDDIIAAAKRAHCHDFIMAMPDGYDTIIGEGGSTLSGGEKQRISIARAILKDAPILLLDEPTASLDAKNEVMIQQAINELIRGRTVVMIAHRLKTIQNAQQILVIEDGCLVQSGTHHSLMQESGLYQKLYQMQQESLGWNYKKE